MVSCSFQDTGVIHSVTLPLRQHNPHVSGLPSSEKPAVLFEQTGAQFQYSSLKHPDSIRLVKLNPSETGTDVLSCSFLDVALSTKPEYEVLSGFWVDQSSLFRLAPLLIDEQSCRTTPQLAEALFRFRSQDRPRLFWIQSLAINIHDTSERGGQIKLLRNTLLSARRLIVWLGAAEDDSDLVFEHVRRFEHLRSKYEFIPSFPQDGHYGREVSHGPSVGAAPGQHFGALMDLPRNWLQNACQATPGRLNLPFGSCVRGRGSTAPGASLNSRSATTSWLSAETTSCGSWSPTSTPSHGSSSHLRAVSPLRP